MPTFVAVDLGATSGRIILGDVNRTVHLTELHRFPTGPQERPGGGLRWDITSIYQEVLFGLNQSTAFDPVSIGIDSWAVDYGLIDSDGYLDGDVRSYRDPRVAGMPARLRATIDDATLYAINGLQYQPFNTIYQLMSEPPDRLTDHTMLLIPDLLTYWLTGTLGAELTNASTTGLIDARTHTWSPTLLRHTKIPPTLLPPLHPPGTKITPTNITPPRPSPTKIIPRSTTAHPPPLPGGGPSSIVPVGGDNLGGEGGACGQPRSCGQNIWQKPTDVVAVGSHDTASAVAAIPAVDQRFGYVSCGTWSLVGVELDEPVLSEAARLANFTNELGVDGRVRFLRNTMGLWLLGESLRVWRGELAPLLWAAAREAELAAVVDANDERYLAPGDIPARIADHCRQTGQRPPVTPAGFVRTIIESLALAHAASLRTAGRLAKYDVSTVHLVGGGARNDLLCQLTADACGLPVLAGPVEASASGNILVQARTAGVDAEPMRPFARYLPHGNRRAWTRAARILNIEL